MQKNYIKNHIKVLTFFEIKNPKNQKNKKCQFAENQKNEKK